MALHLLQSLEPTGVGARHLGECLSLQLKARLAQAAAERDKLFKVLYEMAPVAMAFQRGDQVVSVNQRYMSQLGLKTYTEALAHELRNTPGAEGLTAHLLIPGYTFTGMTKRGPGGKPDAAWTPEQVVHFMLARIEAGDFYILCPDNDVTRATDEKRMAWAMGDIIENRPALSRWHPDWKDAFAAFVEKP